MRRLLPLPPGADDPDRPDVDPVMVYASADRTPRPGRPWVMTNMVMSLDGAIRVGAVSGGLGGAGDKAVFRAIRACADVIVAGAETVRAENYGPAAVPVAVVTGSARLDASARLFSAGADGARNLVVTSASADRARVAALAEVADVEVCGESVVDLVDMLSMLAARGFRTVLCEGGPTLLGQFAAADLIDEYCLTLSPLVVAGESGRATSGAPVVPPSTFRPVSLLTDDDGFCFFRYLRHHPNPL